MVVEERNLFIIKETFHALCQLIKTLLVLKLFLCKVCLLLDQRYDISSKIIHVPQGKNLGEHATKIKEHFAVSASPIMMGGNMDCSSKGIFGIHIGEENTYLLVVDPHFVGRAKSARQLQGDYFVKWQNLNEFIDSSFYNLCLPQIGNPD